MKKTLLLIIIILSSTNLFAQREYFNWYFGKRAGITFNTPDYSPKVIEDSQIYAIEGCASISDSAGNLLFYTNGETIWNKNNEIMEDEEGIMGKQTITQNSIILKKPGADSVYYLFTNFYYYLSSIGHMYYTVLENQGGNNFKITKKNIFIRSHVGEGMTYAQHTNGSDYWIVIHEKLSNKFYCYLFNENGLDTANLVENRVGSMYSEDFYWGIQNTLKVSPNGKHLVSARMNKNLELFDFDNSTGLISNPKYILSGHSYGVEFSPDSKIVYYSTSSGTSSLYAFYYMNLYQYHIETDKYHAVVKDSLSPYCTMQLAPDGNIYTSLFNMDIDPPNEYLGVIKNTNKFGNECYYMDTAINIDTKNYSSTRLGLPNYTQTNFIVRVKAGEDTEVCEGDSLYIGCEVYSPGNDAELNWTGPNGFTSDEEMPLPRDC